MSLLVVSVLLAVVASQATSVQWDWPVPQRKYDSRPLSDPYCKASFQTFCPSGYPNGTIPRMDDDDTLEVFVLKAPIFESKYGDLLGKFDLIHDAIGFKSLKTGLNYTSEWYELFELFNCTFPHILENQTTPIWCNQGAACFYSGINDIHWTQNGTLKKVAEITGQQFNTLADYIISDNNTGIYYETWRVRNSTDSSSFIQWFDPYDCTSYVIRVFQFLGELGVNYTTDYTSNYTMLSLYCDMPTYLANETQVYGPGGDKELAQTLDTFYSYFQAHQTPLHFVESLLHIYQYVMLEKEFFLYYNEAYWRLPMKAPYIKASYEYIPFYTPPSKRGK
ncbi:hypothetical protein EMCRGX_G033235 [Ephydatia muelleri]|eukprot:Em0022g86a